MATGAELDEALLKATANLPSSMQQKLQNGLTQWQAKPQKSLSVLITGKTGAGKSTLTNAILGLEVGEAGAAREGDSITTRCTTKVERYCTGSKAGVNLAVWDSPGFQDGTDHQEEYIEQIKKQCTGVDLIMYCVKISESRFVRGNDNPDVVTMKKLTVAFGPEFWEKAIIVLTFANVLEAYNFDWEDMAPEERAAAFNTKIKEWEGQVKRILIEDIHIPHEIVHEIAVVPAGHERKQHLPGQEYWLSNLWFQCLYTMTSPEAQCALVQMNMTRFKNVKDVKKDDFKQPAQLQPIVFAENILKSILPQDTVEAVLQASTVGMAAGAVFGPTGSLVGGFGGGAIALAMAYSGDIGKAWKKANELKEQFMKSK